MLLDLPIRPAESDDLRHIAGLIDRAIRISNAPDYSAREQMAVMADYTAPELKRMLAHASLFLVAEVATAKGDAPEPGGVIIVTVSGRGAIINGLFVEPALQGMGIGGALIDTAVAHLAAQGPARLAVSASLSAVGFYGHHGFSRVGSGKAGSGVAIVQMVRELR
jgi:GNAT superfamily N-acetyltransferase